MSRKHASLALIASVLILLPSLLAADTSDQSSGTSGTDQQLLLPGRGFIPPAVDIPEYQVTRPANGMPPATLPSRWDCREHGQVSPVKNQSICGCCYAFAGVGNAESKILADGGSLYNFSENDAKECSYGSPSCDGGNHFDVTNLFSTEGMVLEACDPYTPYDVDCDTTCPAVATLLGMGVINTDAIPDIDLLKSYIYTFGPVYTSMYAGNGDAWYSEMNNYDGSYTLYNAATTTSNHAVLIIGWDDDLIHAGGSGAWIVKNSWGTNWGGTCGYGSEKGYFTIAYGSASIGTWSSYMTDWQLTDESDVLFYYNEAGWTGQLGYGLMTAWGLAKFTPTTATDIERIEFWTVDVTTDIDVYIYDDFNGSAPSVLLASKLNSSFTEMGYHSVQLDSPLRVDSGDDFYVVVKVTDESYGLPLAYDRLGTVETGKTFYSPTGASGSWSDAGLASTPKDLTIRARGSAVSCSFAVSSPTSSDTWPLDSTRTITWSSSDAGANVTIELYKAADLQCTIAASTANDDSYDWPVDYCGGGEGSDYRVKVSDAADGGCFAFSDYFTISDPCSLDVTNPTSSSDWPLDSTVTIQWTSEAGSGNVRIFLFKGVTLQCEIDTLTIDDGSYSWQVDYCAGGTATDYRVRVVDAADSNCFDFSDYFTITNPCDVEITSPTAGLDWERDSSVTIEWNSVAAGANVGIYLYNESGLLCDIDTLTANDGSYNWTVDDCGSGGGSDYRIRIEDSADAGCFAESDTFTISIPCSIQVSQPATGADWPTGTGRTIIWNSEGSGSLVRLDLYQDTDSLCTIIASTANDGSFAWTVDDCGNGTASDYRIKITDTGNNDCFDFSDYFTVSIPCELSVAQPSTATVWYVDSLETIQWNSSGAGASTKIDLYKGTSLLCTIDSAAANDGSYEWSVEECGGGYGTNFRIRVIDVADTSCNAMSGYFTITTPCQIEVSSPTSSDDWTQGDSHAIEWSAVGAGANVRLDLYRGANIQCQIAAATANDGSFDWTAADCGGGSGSLYRVRVSDPDIPLCEAFSDYFTVTVLALATDDEQGTLPEEFGLSQNYPNPFNPTTTLEFSLARGSQVELAVYNALGQRVRKLVDGFRSAGHYVVYWDSKDDIGIAAPSGIYLYRLQAGELELVRKMLLLK